MIADGREQSENFETSGLGAWAETWHLWTVRMPRRSISGKLVFGQVWRRRAGRKWEYKKFLKSHLGPQLDRLNRAE